MCALQRTDRLRGEYQARIELKCTDVATVSLRPTDATLVSRCAGRTVASIDRRAAVMSSERVGVGPPIVLQWAELRIDIDFIPGAARESAASGISDQTISERDDSS